MPIVRLSSRRSLSADAAREDGANTGDSGQLGDGWIRLKFGGDPGIDLLDLTFKEAYVLQGEVKDALKGQCQGLIEREALLSHLLEFAGIVEGVTEMVSAEFVQMQGQVFDV